MSLAQRYVLWTESLFRELAKWLTPDECRVLMMVCKRWRVFCFRPQFFFSVWRMPRLRPATEGFLVLLVSHRFYSHREYHDWFGLTSKGRWVQNLRCKGRKNTDPKIQVQLRLFAASWGQLWPRILEVQTAKPAAQLLELKLE